MKKGFLPLLIVCIICSCISLKLHDALIRYNQLFMSIIKSRRVIDNPKERWGEIQDTLYSSGAWADASLGHRSRTMPTKQ